MAVDLGDLLDSLKREISPPGSNAFPNATDDELIGHLQDGFWEARLDGLLAGYGELDAIVTPTSDGAADIARDLQQLVVVYAGIRILRSELREMNTNFRTKAGPVEYETAKSAQVLVALINDFKSRKNLILSRLSDVGVVDSYYIDAANERDLAILNGLTSFTR